MQKIKWRPYQQEAKLAIKQNFDKGVTEQLAVLATGSGKRLLAIDIMNHFPRSLFIAHREELIMQAFEEIEKFFPMQCGIIKGPRFEIDKKIVVASVQTLTNRLTKIPENTFNYIAIDECFPAGTMIDSTPIENIRTGMLVSCFNHNNGVIERKPVLSIHRREYDKSLYDFGDFQCTANHPIFIINIGYCIAKEIYYAYLYHKVMRYGYTAKFLQNLQKLWKRIYYKNRETHLFTRMRNNKEIIKKKRSPEYEMFELWESFQFPRIGEKEKSIHGFSFKRFWLLLRKMQKGTFSEITEKGCNKSRLVSSIRKDEKKQSYGKSRDSRKNEASIKRKNIFSSWRKRKSNQATTYYGEVDPATYGISDYSTVTIFTREESSKVLQSRSSLSGSKISNRNRWENSPIKALEILRQTKDGRIEKSRLDCDKIYKRRNRSKSSKGPEKNYVYNLEVEKNNNYFANSVLVHNCHNYMAKTFLAAVRHFTPNLQIGWTATPKRNDGISLSNIAEKIVFEYTISRGVKEGFLCKLDAYSIGTQTDLTKVRKLAGDFNIGQLSDMVDNEVRNILIMAKYQEYCPKGEQAIGFAVDVRHAYRLRDTFRKYGISSEAVVSDKELCPNRQEIMEDFKAGKVQVLFNVGIATEGFDYSDVGCVIMARPTQSETLYVQCLDTETEILTNNGWRSIDNYKYEDLAAGYDIKTGIISWQPTLSIFKRKELGSLYSVNLPQTDIRVTDGHRMIVSERKGRKKEWTNYKFIKAVELANKKDLVKIPISGIQYTKGLPLTNSQIKFLGLFLSDGSINRITKQVYIAQSEHQKWNEDIIEILNDCGYKYSVRRVVRKTEYSDHSVMLYYNVSNKDTKHIRKWLVKSMPESYEDISPVQLEHLITGLYIGDGHKTNKIDWDRHTYTITTGNKDFANNLQSICVRRGFKCNIFTRKDSAFNIHIKPYENEKKLNFSDNRAKFSKESSTGSDVWCIENPLNTIITRRNGKVSILGNCIGRGTRLKSKAFQEKYGHDHCTILDFVDNTSKHSLVNAYELEKKKPIEERVFLPAEHKEKLLEERRMREVRMREGRDQQVDLLQLPEIKVWDSERMREPATEKQLAWIKMEGFFEEGVEYTKLQASEIISNMPVRLKWQLDFLRRKNYDLSEGATVGQFQKIYQAHKAATKYQA